ncbi:MAG TPA: hypothetical protein VD907_00720 [Verrucomicrobiae bacterium]|nr:hypothetical protein [Verrucomicrobiae bacterium]
MKTNFLAPNKFNRLTSPFRKHHALIFILLALAVMIISVYSINQILSQPVDQNYKAEAEAKSLRTNFDQQTIDKITELRGRGDNWANNLPGGRINPFSE